MFVVSLSTTRDIHYHNISSFSRFTLFSSRAAQAARIKSPIMSSDYNYDDQGQFFPFFMLTMAGLVTIPLTYNVLKASTDLEQTADRIKSDFKPKNVDLIESQRKKRKRRNRKTKRIITVVLGYAFMAYMIYLISVTQRTVPKLWDPYDILGVSRVRIAEEKKLCFRLIFMPRALRKSKLTNGTNKPYHSSIIRTKRGQILPRTRRSIR